MTESADGAASVRLWLWSALGLHITKQSAQGFPGGKSSGLIPLAAGARVGTIPIRRAAGRSASLHCSPMHPG